VIFVMTGAVTVSEALPSTPSSFARAVVKPIAIGVASPLLPTAFETVAVVGLSVLHVTSLVMSRTLPSE
jgi:hypothetical protein